jgi:dTDP-4-dehydrorhamnose 3,5-epimerase
VASLRQSALIRGVQVAELAAHGDSRGCFAEVFRKEWFPHRPWDAVQWSRSESQAGALRGLHYHHRQVDYWHCAAGTMRVGLADLRLTSPTRGATETIVLDQSALRAVYIPAGVAHGFYAVTAVLLFYLVDSYYDGTDELGVAWDDPDLGLDWGLAGVPIVSARDRANPRAASLAEHHLPR